ncbi:hypothetical protein PAAG_02242 [Paracoccidioides lutzii Pb01]|uniref:Life-span regulatory factor domain-containing protein n=1 Tax=Paracoccidioides lutzii (strain ATCC MYA-826 / Pb01) TaxID=502779 RepID=C1GVG5_PARBA|nr:hypothetical protein PAAG_02242 [Paracoccidioides lutzii Pb01]EEH40187.1 hypothetical protein PAAG_02242 [Paracoccidioides lutzii Pb01]
MTQNQHHPTFPYPLPSDPPPYLLHFYLSHKRHLPTTACNAKQPRLSLTRQRLARPLAAKFPLPPPVSPRSRKLPRRPPVVVQTVAPEDKEQHLSMATPFLQFCATCERQIMIPSDSILYCSESCRRKDATKSLEITSQKTTCGTMPPIVSGSWPKSSPSSPTKAKVKAKAKVNVKAITVPTSPSNRTSRSLPSVRTPTTHDRISHLDPTEWKPICKRIHSRSNSITSSEAYRYLSLFQKAEPLALVTDNGGGGSGRSSSAHPVPVSDGSSTSISTTGQGTVPSLAHSPTTSATSSVLNSPTETVSYAPPHPFPPSHAAILPEPSQKHRQSLSPFVSRLNSSSGTGSGISRDLDLVAVPFIADPNNDGSSAENGKKTAAAAFIS